MKTNVKITKRLLSILLVFLFYINSFAATSVSDNDGSAFITKAEFDALKSSFQVQIDTYNQGIDSKIDNAIASYLGNIDIAGEVIDYVEKINNQTGNKFRFINTIPGLGEDTITTDCNIILNFDIYKQKPIIYARVRSYNSATSPGIWYDVCSTLGNMNGHDTGYDLMVSGQSGKQKTLTDTWTYNTWYGLADLETEKKNYSSSKNFVISSGDGCVWEYKRKPDGKIKLASYNSDYYPIQNIIFNNHQWKSYWTKTAAATAAQKTALLSYLTTASGADMGLALTVTATKSQQWGSTSGGTAKSSTDEDSGSWWSMELSKMQSKDTDDWEVLQIGSGVLSSSSIYCINQEQELTALSVTSKALDVKYTEEYYPPQGTSTREVNVGTLTGKYYPVSYTPEEITLNNFINDTLSNITTETVYLGGGAPMCKVPKAKKVKFDLEFALEDASGTAKSGNIYVKLSDKQFEDGDFVTGAKKHVNLSEYITTATGGGKKSYTFDCEANETVWFNIEPSTVGDIAWLKKATYTYVS